MKKFFSVNPLADSRHKVRRRLSTLALGIVLTTLIGGCSSGGSLDSPQARPDSSNPADRILACKSGDTLISGQSQCLQDDAACYQIADGGWCTGPRGNVCPAGSQNLPSGSACPTGARCFRISESLECFIQ